MALKIKIKLWLAEEIFAEKGRKKGFFLEFL